MLTFLLIVFMIISKAFQQGKVGRNLFALYLPVVSSVVQLECVSADTQNSYMPDQISGKYPVKANWSKLFR